MIWVKRWKEKRSGMIMTEPIPFIEFYTDGASRGKYGSSYSFVCIKNGEVVDMVSEQLPIGVTSGEAEYIAIEEAVKYAVDNGVSNAMINTDSESIVEQMYGRAKVKSKQVKNHHKNIKELINGRNIQFNHAGRNNVYIGLTDGLCDREVGSRKRSYRKG